MNSDTTPSSEMIYLDADCQLRYVPDFLNRQDADRLYASLVCDILWQQDEIMIFGRHCKIPRLQHYQAEAGLDYRYSGLTMAAQPFDPRVAVIKKRLAEYSETPFNAALLNYYRNGKDSMGWHSDDEVSLGSQPVIASVSLGETRRFLLREKANHRHKYEIALSHGSLLIMEGATQRLWQHSVAKTAQSINGRINLTFRQIIK